MNTHHAWGVGSRADWTAILEPVSASDNNWAEVWLDLGVERSRRMNRWPSPPSPIWNSRNTRFCTHDIPSGWLSYHTHFEKSTSKSMQTDRKIHLQNSWTKSQSAGRCVGAVVYLFPITWNSKKNLLPIFLHPSCSSAFWDVTWRVINARSTCFPENWLNVSLCWLLLSQLLLALVVLQFLFSF